MYGIEGILGETLEGLNDIKINEIIRNKENREKLNNIKTLTMENIFNELKEKINKYKESLKNSESVEMNNSEVVKIEEEIKNLKLKIDELNSSIEGKSKIEKMKITLNVSSIESEIFLKEMDLEEQKQKVKKEYDGKVQNSNINLENLKNNLNKFIKNREENIEKIIKGNNFKGQNIVVAGRKLTDEEIKSLENIGLNPLYLVDLNLTDYDLKDLIESCRNKANIVMIEQLKKVIERKGVKLEEIDILYGILDIITLSKSNLKQKLDPIFDRIDVKVILGADLEEAKNYYDNIMKVELPNLENIRVEESNIDKQIDQITKKMNEYYSEADRYQSQGTQWALKKPITFFGNYDEDKADDYRDNMTYCHDEASRYRKMAIAENDKLIPLNKEKEKLKIKREAIENKIKTIDEMVDEMIKEVIKEELKKREIVIPNFVPVTKYFNAPDEVEE